MKDTKNIPYNNCYDYFYTENFELSKSFYEGKKILDIGCGSMGSLEWADNALMRVGLDPLLSAYKNFDINTHKMSYVLAPAENIPFPDNYFDVVALFDSLDHVENISKTISEITRVLNVGGTFLLITEVNQKPTAIKPISFSWDIVKKFEPTLKLIKEDRYEKNELGVYQSINKSNYFRENYISERSGVLSARFIKNEPISKKMKQSPRNLPGEFWGITTLFSPAGYKRRYKNYILFRQRIKKQGLNLLVVELAFNDQKFILNKDDADILIQIRIGEKGIMWQKEAILNIALKHLPNKCDKVAWLDSDIIFNDNNWIERASALLEKYCVIQLFSYVIRLPEGKTGISNIEKLKEGSSENQKLKGRAYSIVKGSPNTNAGYAWAARKELLYKVGFYDEAIIGGGDRLMSYAFFNDDIKRGECGNCCSRLFTNEMFLRYFSWYDNVSKIVKGSAYYLDGFIFHLWHGAQANRFHGERELILLDNNFNPRDDIKKNKDGLWEWASIKPIMQENIKKYFFARNDDGKTPKIISWFEIASLNFTRNHFRIIVDRNIGRAGAIMNKLFPKLYYLIKKNFYASDLLKFEVKKTINVCTAVDSRQVRYFPTMVNSISKNAENEIILFLLARDLSIEEQRAITNMNFPNIKINIISTDKYFRDINFKLPEHISKSAMDRILLPSLLPKIKKIIYLDIDLVVNADLKTLFNMETSEKGICAKSCISRNFKTIKKHIKSWYGGHAELLSFLSGKTNMNARCFNTGVMVLDLNKLRENRFLEKIIPFLKKYPFADQLWLNIYANGNYAELPNSWNVLVTQENPKEKNIIHWIGPKKPWDNENIQFREFWWKYYLPPQKDFSDVQKYWQDRKNLKYYRRVIELCKLHAPEARTIIDIGSNKTKILDDLKYIKERTALDKGPLPESEEIIKIREDFYRFKSDKRYDVALCLQTLEHVDDPKSFLQKIFQISRTSIISVPYKWPPGNKYHKHHLLDQAEVFSWAEKKPVCFEVAKEEKGDERIIFVYKNN